MKQRTDIHKCGCVHATFLPFDVEAKIRNGERTFSPYLVEWRPTVLCNTHLATARRRTVALMVRHRDAITNGARQMQARRMRYENIANSQRGTLLIGLVDDVTGDVYSYLSTLEHPSQRT